MEQSSSRQRSPSLKPPTSQARPTRSMKAGNSSRHHQYIRSRRATCGTRYQRQSQSRTKHPNLSFLGSRTLHVPSPRVSLQKTTCRSRYLHVHQCRHQSLQLKYRSLRRRHQRLTSQLHTMTAPKINGHGRNLQGCGQTILRSSSRNLLRSRGKRSRRVVLMLGTAFQESTHTYGQSWRHRQGAGRSKFCNTRQAWTISAPRSCHENLVAKVCV
jgi:hypothetical protein